MPNICIQHHDTPAGKVLMGSFKDKLCLFDWSCRTNRALIDKRLQQTLETEYCERDTFTLQQARTQIDEYFKHERQRFEMPLLILGTAFQKRVRQEIAAISYGTTRSYLALAQKIGNEKAVRATSAAVGANAISILIPCHRVIGSNGSFVGYAGGLFAKRKLLALEQSR